MNDDSQVIYLCVKIGFFSQIPYENEHVLHIFNYNNSVSSGRSLPPKKVQKP